MRTSYWIPTASSPQYRDLGEESKSWSRAKYLERDGLDVYNFLWNELCNYREYRADGCIYEVGGVFVSPGDIVVDAEANIGIWSNVAMFKGAKQVYAFEPTLKSFNCLCENTDQWLFHPSHYYPQVIKPFCLALGDKKQVIEMPVWESGDSVGSRIDGSITSTQYNTVMVTTLDDLFDIGLFDHIDYLKLDVEGAEDQVLYSLSRERLGMINKISMEYHPNALSDSEDVIKYLMSNKFRHIFTLHMGEECKIITFSKL